MLAKSRRKPPSSPNSTLIASSQVLIVNLQSRFSKIKFPHKQHIRKTLQTSWLPNSVAVKCVQQLTLNLSTA